MSRDKFHKKGQTKRSKYPKKSSTKGILKGESCRKTVLKTEGCKNSRMHRTKPDQFRAYEEELVRVNKGNYHLPKLEETD